MFVLESYIEIGGIAFDQVRDVKITRSVDLLADTAVIKLPTKFVLEGDEQDTAGVILPGQKVKITLAYEDVIERTEFVGYVKEVRPNTPVEIHCEDAMYVLRRININKNFTNTTLEKVLAFILQGTDIKLSGSIPLINLEKFLIKNSNGAVALQKIKKTYGLSCYIDNNGALFCGLRQQEGVGNRVIYQLEGNTISHKLQYKLADQVRIKLKAIAWQKDNKKIEVTVGDADGEQRTWQTYEVLDEQQLKRLAESKLASMKYDGYDGSIQGFLVPYADRGMTAEIYDDQYPERAGSYFIPKVVTRFGISGARRTVTLGRKVS